MEEKRMVCIACPIGCSLSISKENDKITVKGNSCPRGEAFAIQEMVDPKRMLTTTMLTANGKMLPVISTAVISKNILMNAIDVLKKKCVKTPIKQGEIIIENILNTGVNIVASKTME